MKDMEQNGVFGDLALQELNMTYESSIFLMVFMFNNNICNNFEEKTQLNRKSDLNPTQILCGCRGISVKKHSLKLWYHIY